MVEKRVWFIKCLKCGFKSRNTSDVAERHCRLCGRLKKGEYEVKRE